MQKAVLDHFWQASFTDSWNLSILYYYHLNVRSPHQYFELWQKKTKEEPKWIPDEDFFAALKV